jgi:hypothetical protein
MDSWTPTSRLALERRIGDGTWLIVNARASYDRRLIPISNVGDPGVTRSSIERVDTFIGLLLGVRRVVTKGLVEISLIGTAGVARSAISGDALRANELPSSYGLDPGDRTDVVGVSGGIAVERELVSALSLRLTADLVAASYSRTHDVSVDSSGVATRNDYHAFSAGLALAPGLEVHLYF